MERERFQCPKCEEFVDRVDGEYARHYVFANVLCTGSRREIVTDNYKAERMEEGNP